MKRLFVPLIFLLFCNAALADGSDMYVLKVEICTVDNTAIIGFIKINDYAIDSYLDKTKPETIKDLLIEHVQYTKEAGMFSYFNNSIHYVYKLTPEASSGFDVYQLQNERSIWNKEIKSIAIIDKKFEERSLSVITKLESDNPFWLTKKPLKVIDMGGDDEYCFYNAVIYSTNDAMDKKLNEKLVDSSEDLHVFFAEQIKAGEQIVVVQTCSE